MDLIRRAKSIILTPSQTWLEIKKEKSIDYVVVAIIVTIVVHVVIGAITGAIF